MNITARNPFERAGRYRKATALVRVIDGICSDRSRQPVLHPVRDGERIASNLATWPDEYWRAVAEAAGVIPKSGKLPSAETRQAVAQFYRERARDAAKHSEASAPVRRAS